MSVGEIVGDGGDEFDCVCLGVFQCLGATGLACYEGEVVGIVVEAYDGMRGRVLKFVMEFDEEIKVIMNDCLECWIDSVTDHEASGVLNGVLMPNPGWTWEVEWLHHDVEGVWGVRTMRIVICVPLRVKQGIF